MTTHTKRLHQLPNQVTAAFSSLRSTTEKSEQRNTYIVELRAQGWTLESIALASNMTRERVRQIVALNKGKALAASGLPLPTPPIKEIKAPKTYTEPTTATLTRLLELQPNAQKPRANVTTYRADSDEYTKLVHHAHTVEGVPIYRLAKRLGVTNAALRSRLLRHGYMKPVN
jgi:hypothetical protein